MIWIAEKYVNRHIKKLKKHLLDNLLEKAMMLLLKIMSLTFCLDKNYRKNIENFAANYLFTISQNSVDITVSFKNSKMKVKNKSTDNFDVQIVIKDFKSLLGFVTSGGNVFEVLLNGGFYWKGNLNYILKFSYMAIHPLIKWGININDLMPEAVSN